MDGWIDRLVGKGFVEERISKDAKAEDNRSEKVTAGIGRFEDLGEEMCFMF